GRSREEISARRNYRVPRRLFSSIPSAAHRFNRKRMSKKLRVLFAIDEMSAGGSQRQIIGILRRLDRARFEPHLYVVADHGELLAEVPSDVPTHIFAQRNPRRRWWLPGQWFRARVRDVAAVLQKQKIDCLYDRTYHMTLVTAPATQ